MSHPFLIPAMSEIHSGSGRGNETEMGKMKPKEEPRRKGTVKENKETNQVAIAVGFHLFPSRTEKLSPRAPMVLRRNAGE